MVNKYKKLFNYIKIFIITSLLISVNLILAYSYIFNNNGWVHSLAEYTDGEITLVCHDLNCVFVKNEASLEANDVSELNKSSISNTIDNYLYSLAEETNPDNPNTINYTDINTLSVTEVLLLIIGLLTISLSVVLLIVISYPRGVSYDTSSGKLRDELRVNVVTAAYHKLITPLALVRVGISDLEQVYNSGDVTKENVKEPLDTIIPMIEQVDDIVHQIAIDGLSHTNTVESINTIITNTMTSIKTIYKNYSFNYTIEDEKGLSTITTKALCYITLSHIFNTIFKGSLDTNATDIAISYYKKGSTLSIFIMDNGNRRTTHDDLSCNITDRSCIVPTKLNPILNNTPTTNGLCLAKKILDTAGGSLTLVQTGLAGTVFKITLPIITLTNTMDKD